MTALQWPELYFIRHGQTDWNAEKRYQGQRDIPLNATGQGQADLNGHTLRRLFEARQIDPNALEWHVSPLGRTRETMQRIRAAFDGPLPEVSIDPRLMEISFGALEGLLHAELPSHMATAPGDRGADYWEFRPEGGENYLDVEARLSDFALDLGGPSVVVAHGGVARVLRVLVQHAPIADVINWTPAQDVIMHFTEGHLELIGVDDV
ncbi:phosphoglycerate mutase [Youhaiella tibetensis]|uniref:Histidine phosphatase family protein n=1 Tax=Paradevosia tibetensis TaxID=1447062 RepID=A0A5B9DKS2_9HYPH|nr:histidine phosphatase family protein [Youhaiella tibetensis]AKR54546.1 Phosphoglycerate mutase family (Rhiz) [Devosia sp. H5989]QEE19666.1 histidine phosphatase family protein [Youhaiella tibetensis]GGF31065.1 phosphoglycerate mutase [Youhaiella tibetensis]